MLYILFEYSLLPITLYIIDMLYILSEYSLLPITFYIILYYPICTILFSTIICILNDFKKDKRELKEKYPSLNFYQWCKQHRKKWIQNIVFNKENINLLYTDMNSHNIKDYLNNIENNLEFWKYSQFKEDNENGKQKYIDYIYEHIQNKNADNIFIIELVIAYYYITYYGIENNIKEKDIISEMHYCYCCILSHYKGQSSYIKYQYLYDDIDNIEKSQINIYQGYLKSHI